MRSLRAIAWPSRDLGFYLGCVTLVSLGVFVHVILFNLYLVDAGFREDLMGRQQMLMTAGTALGILPASWAGRRFGLRRTIAFSIAGIALALGGRAHAEGVFLSVASILAGAFLAGWFVSNAPAVAALARTGDEARTTAAFGFNIALAIAVGALGGLIGARLPGWIPAATPLAAKRAALGIAALLAAAGIAPLLRVRFPAGAGSVSGFGAFQFFRKQTGAGAFLARYFVAVAPWYLFGAGFLPFMNVFLKNRFNASLGDVGNVFAISQVIQAGAVLLAVPLSALVGNVRSIALFQLLAAGGLFAMWPARTLAAASAVYIVYIAFQVMSEPGLQSLLMSSVAPEDRSAASGLNLLVMFGMQALAGGLAGMVIVARGYGAWFVMLSLLGVASAGLFAALFVRASRTGNAPAATAAQNSPGRP